MDTDPKLSPEEAGYILKMLKEHLDYYRLLSSAKHRAKREMLERLMAKLQSVKLAS